MRGTAESFSTRRARDTRSTVYDYWADAFVSSPCVHVPSAFIKKRNKKYYESLQIK